MKKKRYFFDSPFFFYAFISILLQITLSQNLVAQDLAEIPPLKSRVTDTTGTLTKNQASELESILRSFQLQKGAEIVLLIVPSVKPETIESYSIRLAEKWKIGRKKIDDGAILLVAKNDKKVRIEVGYGLEGAIPDITANRIIRKLIIPYFKEDNFYMGVRSGLMAMINAASGESLPPPPKTAKRPQKSSNIMFIFFLLVVSSLLLRSLVGSSIATFLNIFVGALVGFFLLDWLVGGLIGLGSSFFSGGHRGGYLGGMGYHVGRGGMGGFGGGMGGFGGGGGGFGGGGSSGSW